MVENEAIQFIIDSINFIKSNHLSERYIANCKITDWIKSYLPKVENLKSQDSKYLSIAFVGEFKAGKSSLINAILQKEVVYVDSFEATTTINVISPGSKDEVIIRRNSKVLYTLSIQNYLTACKIFKFRDVDRVDITINHNLPIILIDTPGMGSITEVHEKRAEKAIMELADLIVWVMDSGDILSAKETAFLIKAKELNLPIWCLLSKTDMLSDVEIEECIDYISNATALTKEKIIPISVSDVSSRPEIISISDLTKMFIDNANHVITIRNQAKVAKFTELINEYESALSLLNKSVSHDIEWINDERNLFTQQSNNISLSLQSDIKNTINNHFINYLKKRLTCTTIHSYDSACDIVNPIINDYLSTELQYISNDIISVIESNSRYLWNQDYKLREYNLRAQLEQLVQDKNKDIQTEAFLNDQLSITRDRSIAINNTFSNISSATGLAALLLITNPVTIASMIVIAISGMYLGKKFGEFFESNTSSEKYSISESSISSISNDFSNIFYDNIITPLLSQYLTYIVENAINERCLQYFNGNSENDLLSLLDILNKISQALLLIKSKLHDNTIDFVKDLPKFKNIKLITS